MTSFGDTAVIDQAWAGGGSFSTSGWPGAGFDPGPYSPFAHPFAGWIALSDLIADSNPGLADAMRMLGAVLQAAVEQSVAARFPEIHSSLLQAGIPRWSIDDVERTLLSGLLPLSAREIDGLTNPRFQGNAVTTEYRADIDEWQPTEFSESIDLGKPLDQYYYVYELTDPKRSRAIRKLRSLLQRNGPAIQQVINAASDTAINLGTSVAAPMRLPVTALAPLTKPVARMFWGGLMSSLGKALADTNMTPWTITHTTLHSPDYPVGPLSMFILLSPSAPTAKLHRIRRDDIDPDVSTVEAGYEEKKRAYQRGRGMMGLTQPPSRPCPADLWGHVADNNEPAAWTEPERDQAGFRVLVPHAEAGADASYVSAIRADVLEYR